MHENIKLPLDGIAREIHTAWAFKDFQDVLYVHACTYVYVRTYVYAVYMRKQLV